MAAVNEAVRPLDAAAVFESLGPEARWQGRFVVTTLLADALVLVLSTIATEWVLVATGDGFNRWSLLAVPLWLVVIASCGGYDRRFIGVGSTDYQRVLHAGAIVATTTVIAGFVVGSEVSRLFVVLMAGLGTGSVLVVRQRRRHRLWRKRCRGQCLQRVLLVGNDRSLDQLTRHFNADPDRGFQIVGACLDGTAPSGRLSETGVEVLGGLDDVTVIAALTAADVVAVAPDAECDGDRLRRIAWALERSGVDLVVASQLVEIASPRIRVRPVGGLALLHIQQPRFDGAATVAKTTIDRVVAAVALLALSPLLIMIGLAVRLTSSGGALFRQVRVGKNGQLFSVFKFRTMCADAEVLLPTVAASNACADGVLFKLRADPRTTRLGRILRRTSLDELPQLINVVTGSMSLVGPRPALPSEVAAYGADMRRRLLIKPGITGLWQVSGRSDLSWEQTVRLDLRYVENWSFTLDLLILAKTLRAVVSSSGAY